MEIFLDEYIFQGFKPVFWSPSSETALAESEVEFHDIESYSIYVAFEIKNLDQLKLKKKSHLLFGQPLHGLFQLT